MNSFEDRIATHSKQNDRIAEVGIVLVSNSTYFFTVFELREFMYTYVCMNKSIHTYVCMYM